MPLELRPEDRTPVLGRGQRERGLVAALRRRAYARPAHDPLHWLLLLLADRVEVAGALVRDLVVPGRQPLALRHFARQVRSYPRGFGAVGALLGLALLWRGARRG